jgi:hypothetical protein
MTKLRMGLLLLGIGLLGIARLWQAEDAPVAQSTAPRSEALREERASASMKTLVVTAGESSLVRLGTIDEHSPSEAVYEEFSKLKERLQADPSLVRGIIQEIAEIQDDSPASRRRLSVLFGTLAQSGPLDTSRDLIVLAETCRSQYCRIQALMALHEQEQPDPSVLDRLQLLAERSEENHELRDTSYLAAGSVAERLGPAGEQLAPYLLSRWSEVRDVDGRVVLLRAMGNHGEPTYLRFLKERLKESDPQLRAAAVTAMRTQKLPESRIPELLLDHLAREKDPEVLQQGLSTLAYLTLERRHIQVLSALGSEWPSEDLQLELARVLVMLYEAEPEKVRSSLQFLGAKSASAKVRSFISQSLAT